MGLPLKLVQPHRILITEGEVMRESSGKKSFKMLHFFLFNDILLQCVPKRRKFQYKKLYELDSIKAVGFPDNTKPCCFRLMTKDSGYDFVCSTQELKDKWLSDINSTVFNWKKNDYSRRIASQKHTVVTPDDKK